MIIMGEEDQETYNEGYSAYRSGKEEHNNPYSGIDAEFWSDGWEDAQDDDQQS